MKRRFPSFLPSFLLIFATIAIFSCSKEATIDPVFVEKPFFVENPETATAKVLDFLSYTDLTEITLRSDYPDTEVNEGLWTLEASRNYIDNVNILAKSDETINYTLSITNIVDDGVIKMSGADMAAKFNQLHASISGEEANGKTAKIADMELQHVSNQQTDLTIGIIYSLTPPPPPPPAGCEEWPASQSIWSSGPTIAACLTIGAVNYAWYQTVKISAFGDTRILNCSNPNLVCECVWEDYGEMMDYDKFEDAYLTTLDFIDCIILDVYGPSLPNVSNQYGNPHLVDITLQGNSAGDILALFCDEIIVGRGVPH